MTVLIPEKEQERLSALRSYDASSCAREQVTDDLTLLAARTLGTPIAALSFFGESGVCYKATYGADLAESPRLTSFCAQTILNPLEATVVSDTRKDKRFRQNPLVRDIPHIRSYVAAPLIARGFQAIGALCVMDTCPRHFTIDQIEALRVLARQVVNHFEMQQQKTLLIAANDKLRILAASDSLTGLKNHRALMERLDDEIVYARCNRSAVSLVLLDVDNFKSYNDTYGHPAGDDVLRAVSILLLESSREYDFVARYGGEEFGIILRGAETAEAWAVAERFRNRIAAANWPLRRVTVSIGVATCSHDQFSAGEEMIAKADLLLYVSKEGGKNRVTPSQRIEVFNPSLWEETARQLRVKSPA